MIGSRLLLDGTITSSQVAVILICTVIFIIVVPWITKKFFGLFRFIFSSIMIIIISANLALFSPQKTDISNLPQSKTQIMQIAKTSSDKVRFDTKNGLNVYVKLDEKWINVGDITYFTKAGSRYTVFAGKNSYTTHDSEIGDVLSLIKEQ